MRTGAALALVFAVAAGVCRAEPRWCSVTTPNPSNKVVYPAIAKAARVQGVVLAHMIYAPNGRVEQVEAISGPVMLSRSLHDQLMGWTVRTDAVGNELCETLVIAEFSFSDSGDPVQLERATPSILRIAIQAEVLIISDPAGQLSGFSSFRYRLRRAMNWLFQRRN
jgi:hypothetical protein